MEYIGYILLFFIVLSTLLKAGFYRWWGILLLAAGYALFTLLAGDWAVEQSKTALSAGLLSRPVQLNASVFITCEAIIMIAFCFDCFKEMRTRNTFFKQAVSLLLYLYPGLLFAIPVCYTLLQAFFARPGTDFKLITQIAALAVFLSLAGGARLLRRLLKKKGLRYEMLFIVNLFIIILGILVTGN